MFIKREHSHLSTTAKARDGDSKRRFGELRTADNSIPGTSRKAARLGEKKAFGYLVRCPE